MTKLPLDYLGKHFARPLARFVRAENSYDFAPLRISQRRVNGWELQQISAADIRRESALRLRPVVVLIHLCAPRNGYIFRSLYPHRQL